MDDTIDPGITQYTEQLAPGTFIVHAQVRGVKAVHFCGRPLDEEAPTMVRADIGDIPRICCTGCGVVKVVA